MKVLIMKKKIIDKKKETINVLKSAIVEENRAILQTCSLRLEGDFPTQVNDLASIKLSAIKDK